MGRTSDARERLIDAMVELSWERNYGSLTIDMICEKAGVKKGSFYYFFKSKQELGMAAIDHIWECIQPDMDRMYSPSVPPLERLAMHMQRGYVKTKMIAEEHGCVLGCPFFTIGSEISTIDPELSEKVGSILNRSQRYMEAAITQAVADGDLQDIDVKEATRIIFNLFEGMLTQARIKNDPEIMKDLPVAAARILGLARLPEVSVSVTL